MAAIRLGCPISFQASTICELANARPLVSTCMAVAGSRSRHSFRTPMKSSQSDKVSPPVKVSAWVAGSMRGKVSLISLRIHLSSTSFGGCEHIKQELLDRSVTRKEVGAECRRNREPKFLDEGSTPRKPTA